MQMPANDREFQEYTIEEVRPSGTGYEVVHNGAWVLFCPKVDGLPDPKPGDTLRAYGRGIGSTVRGIAVNGRVYRYQTADEEQAAHKQWCREQDAKREAELAANIENTDRRIAALPTVFRERMEKFQRDGGHAFRRDHEPYELFCCEQAVVIAAAFQSEALTPQGADEALRAWARLPWEAQKAQVPALDDGHSGNTFGMAVRLAHWYLSRPENVVREHGALTPLVGCEDYGCKHETPA